MELEDGDFDGEVEGDSDGEEMVMTADPNSPAKAETRGYDRGEALGGGGLAVVYRARQRALNRPVALKEFREIFQYFQPGPQAVIRERLEAAIQQAATLSHPHILCVLDYHGEVEFPYVVTELCGRGSLRTCLESEGRLPVGLAVQYFLQLGEA